MSALLTQPATGPNPLPDSHTPTPTGHLPAPKLAELLDPPTFDRFDIAEAWSVLEPHYNVGGWLRERPSNRRRRESCGVQLHRMGFRARPSLDGMFRNLTRNGQAIYLAAVARLELPDPELRVSDLAGVES
jgi:hypothetical protein